jgi:hypothetical protein
MAASRSKGSQRILAIASRRPLISFRSRSRSQRRRGETSRHLRMSNGHA